MHRRFTLVSVIPVMLISAWLDLATVDACSLCGTPSISGLMLDHPKAIEIALATRAATEKGLLKDPLPSEIQGLDIMPARLIQHRLLPDYPPETSVELILVDNGIRRPLLRSGEAHQPATVQIITTTRTLHAVLTNSLTSAAAITAGILLVDVKNPLIRGITVLP